MYQKNKRLPQTVQLTKVEQRTFWHEALIRDKKKLLWSDAETSDEISLLQVEHSVQDPWIYF